MARSKSTAMPAACVAGTPAELTSYQFDLLLALAERAGRVPTRDQIMEAVRGRELETFDRSIDVHMGRIRAAIETDPKNPKRILTVRGVGYVFARQQGVNKLYLRIWLAVVATVAVLTFLVGWAWRMAAEPPLREVVARNASGDIIGQGQAASDAGTTAQPGYPRRAVASAKILPAHAGMAPPTPPPPPQGPQPNPGGDVLGGTGVRYPHERRPDHPPAPAASQPRFDLACAVWILLDPGPGGRSRRPGHVSPSCAA